MFDLERVGGRCGGWALAILLMVSLGLGAEPPKQRFELSAEFGGAFITNKSDFRNLVGVDPNTGQLVLVVVRATSSPPKTGRLLVGLRYYFTRSDAFEASYSYSPTDLRERFLVIRGGGLVGNTAEVSVPSHASLAAFNYVRYFKGSERWRPFVTGGLGFAHFFQSANAWKFAANFGGGVDLPLNKRLSLRFEYRDYLVGQPLIVRLSPKGLAHYHGPSTGLAIKF